jgi:hypothetical protein
MLLAGAAALFASSAKADYIATLSYSDAGCATQTSASYAQIGCVAMSGTTSECLDRKRARARALLHSPLPLRALPNRILRCSSDAVPSPSRQRHEG